LAAGAILAGGLWLAGRLAQGARRLLGRHPRMDSTVASFIASVVRYVALAVVLIAVLQTFGIPTTSIVAVLGAATLAIGLALQGTLSNVAAGVMLVMFRPYRIGDFVEVAGKSGVVIDVSIFTTELKTFDNIRIVLPNAQCWGAPIVNYFAYETRRLDLEFGVSYDADLDHAETVIRAALTADARVFAEPAPLVKVSRLGDFAVTILAQVWCKTSDHFLLRLDAAKAVKLALDRAGVVIPYPTSAQYQYEVQPRGNAAAGQEGARPRA
jgi:small conductance mechanosensitive channel